MGRKRKDDNHGEITRALERCGFCVIDMTGDPSVGFDVLVVGKGIKEIAEIKDGSKPPSARRLTNGEEKRKAQIESKGCAYRVWESVDEALRCMGAIR